MEILLNPFAAKIGSTVPSSGNTAAEVGVQFRDQLARTLSQVNEQLHVAEEMGQQMLMGQVFDVSQVMIESTKAQLALELTIQVRNKVLEAYQEIMRMQV